MEVIIAGDDINSLNKLQAEGYKVIWVGNGQICLKLVNDVNDLSDAIGYRTFIIQLLMWDLQLKKSEASIAADKFLNHSSYSSIINDLKEVLEND